MANLNDNTSLAVKVASVLGIAQDTPPFASVEAYLSDIILYLVSSGVKEEYLLNNQDDMVGFYARAVNDLFTFEKAELSPYINQRIIQLTFLS